MKFEFGDYYPQCLTPQEHLIVASSAPFQTEPPKIYIPLTILEAPEIPHVRAALIINARKIRHVLRVYRSGIVGSSIGIDDVLTFSLEDLDPVTGQTLRDPGVLGIWDDKTRTVREVRGRDLNGEFYERLLELNKNSSRPYNYWLRGSEKP